MVQRSPFWWQPESKTRVEISPVQSKFYSHNAHGCDYLHVMPYSALGYATLASLLVTLHLGGAWSNFANENTGFIVRFLAYTFAPVGLIVAVYSRIRFVLLCCVRLPLI